ASALVILRGGSGRRALPPTTPGRSAANDTSSSGWRAIARRQPVTARLNGSVGASLTGPLGLMLEDIGAAISVPVAPSPQSAVGRVWDAWTIDGRRAPHPARFARHPLLSGEGKNISSTPRSRSSRAAPARSSADRTRRRSDA